MKAAFFNRHGGAEVLEVGDLPAPKPAPGEVLVRVRFAALNHLDVFVRKGWPGLKIAFPHVLGADASGVVEQLGPGVTSIKVGAEVIVYPGLSCGACDPCRTGVESLCAEFKILGENTNGTDAELVCVPAVNVFAKPERMSLQEAAAFSLVFVTAWEMLVNKAGVKRGDLVLVHAAGSGVSSAAIQIAKLFGATVIATSGAEAKLERAKALGADELINTRAADFAAEIKRAHRPGVDIIVDHVGAAFWEKNLRCLKSGGTLVTCGATSGFDATTNLAHLFYRQLKLVGSTMGSKRDFPDLLRHLESGKLKPVVDRIFPLSEIREAHAYLERGEQFGKVLLSN